MAGDAKMNHMRTIIALLVLSWGTTTALAQSTAAREAAREATDVLTATYGLTAVQIPQMLEIQERRFRNLEDIEPLKSTDESLYRIKLRNIRMGTEASIERILSADQRPILEKERVERRKEEAARLKMLRESGATKAEIQQAILEMETTR